jgi:hypothetical protein
VGTERESAAGRPLVALPMSEKAGTLDAILADRIAATEGSDALSCVGWYQGTPPCRGFDESHMHDQSALFREFWHVKQYIAQEKCLHYHRLLLPASGAMH